MQQQLQKSHRVHTRPREATVGVLGLPMGTTPTTVTVPLLFVCVVLWVCICPHRLPAVSFCLYNYCQNEVRPGPLIQSINTHGSGSWSQWSASEASLDEGTVTVDLPLLPPVSLAVRV